MTEHSGYTTRSGRALTDADIDGFVAEAEAGYDVATLRKRGGRPLRGSAPANVVPVRLEPDLLAAADARAEADATSRSEVIRAALREYLHVA